MHEFRSLRFLSVWCSFVFLIVGVHAQSTDDGAKGIQFKNAENLYRHKKPTATSKPPVHDLKPSPEKSEEQVGVKYQIELTRQGEVKIVPSTFHFIEGDVVHLRCDLNEDSYVYIFHQTLQSNSSGDKGITATPTTYKVLYPQGDAHKLSAGKDQVIPDDVILRIDSKPGIEKLYVLISKKPLDATISGTTSNVQLRQILAASRSNTQSTDLGMDSKGIDATKVSSTQPINYALTQDPDKPFLVVITLQHDPRPM